jgi:hypothetical protein
MAILQLDFFKTEEQSEIEELRKSFEIVQKSSDKVRKKLFAENGKHAKIIDDLSIRLEIIERNLCCKSLS